MGRGGCRLSYKAYGAEAIDNFYVRLLDECYEYRE